MLRTNVFTIVNLFTVHFFVSEHLKTREELCIRVCFSFFLVVLFSAQSQLHKIIIAES